MTAGLILFRLLNGCTTCRAASTLKMDSGWVQGLWIRLLPSAAGSYCRAGGGCCLVDSIGCL